MVLEYMVTVWDTAEPKTYCHDNVKVKLDLNYSTILGMLMLRLLIVTKWALSRENLSLGFPTKCVSKPVSSAILGDKLEN